MLGDKIFSKKIKKDQRNIQINQLLSIPFESENRHVFVVGKPGTGKTQLMNRSIQKVIDRNEKAIIYDFKGDFISHFYDPKTDYIFNPFDQRTIGWNPFNEIANIQNIEAVCYSLIPPSQKQDTFWDEAARDVLFSVLLFCFKNNKKTNNDIYKVTIKTREQLLEDFKTTEGCERGIRCLDEAKTGASVLATFSQYVKFFEYCRDFDGEFSIKKWVADENTRGRIFIVNYAEIGQVMRPFLSLFIDLFASKILMLNENINRRIFFFLDEFGTLQRLNNIANLLKLSRSFGGSLWIGIQDIGQIEKVYGREISKTIVNSCANSIMFGCDDAETAEALARKIGEHEQRIVTENFSFGVENMRDGRGVSERNEVKKAVLAAEFLALIDLEFFLKLSGISEFTRSKLNHISYENRSEKFIEKISSYQNMNDTDQKFSTHEEKIIDIQPMENLKIDIDLNDSSQGYVQ